MNLKEMFDRLIKEIDERIKVAIPCKVESVKGSKVKIKTQKGLVLPDVPVFHFASAKDCGLFLPIKKGTEGALICFDDDLSGWLVGTQENQLLRKHAISNCYFVAGYSSNKNRKDIPPNLELQNGSMIIEMDGTGKIRIQGGSKEVLDLVTKFMDKGIDTLESIITDTLVVNVGAGTGVHSPALITEWVTPVAGLKALLESYKSDLESIKL